LFPSKKRDARMTSKDATPSRFPLTDLSLGLAYGSAYDQLPLFAAKQWHPLPYHRADVQAQRVGAPLQLAY